MVNEREIDIERPYLQQNDSSDVFDNSEPYAFDFGIMNISQHQWRDYETPRNESGNLVFDA
jgi:hypothetical protein